MSHPNPSWTAVTSTALKTLASLALLAALSSAVSPQAHAATGGWADVNGSPTGGAGGPTITVSNLSDLAAAIGDDSPRIVNVSGTINLGSSNARFGSNKTIQGVGANSGFIGNLKGVEESNVIIQRLNFSNPNVVGDGDGLSLEGCTKVWVDHCTFVDCGDGSLDIKRAADLITVSWCLFRYTFDSGHNFVNLLGHSDSNGSQDTGRLRITMHHNWYSTLCKERMPRVRFGQVHVYNNFYGSSGSNYCIGVGNNCQIRSQNCYFEGQPEAWKNYSSSGNQGLINYSGHVFVNCSQPTWAPNSSVFNPPYSFSLDGGSNVKSIVTAGAGAGGSGGGGGGGGSGGTFTRLQNRATGLFADGMGRASNGSALGQYANTNHNNAHWAVESVSGYMKFRNRTTSLYIDGMGATANGSACAQWGGGSSFNQQWAQETVGSYYKFRNRATGLYLDGMGRTANGSDMGQWASSSSNNQQFSLVSP